MTLDLDTLDFGKSGGTVTVVTIDDTTGRVLMVAHADREALALSLSTGEMHYRSRSRGLWRKGATSGNVQRVVAMSADCDGDAVIARVLPAGPACHTGERSCFDSSSAGVLDRLSGTIAARATETGASASYTQRLLTDRNMRLKKIGEEAAELVTAAADGDAARTAEEAADLLYHMMVVLHGVGSSLEDVERVLATRATAPRPKG